MRQLILDIVQLIGGAILCIGYVPQLLQLVRMRSSGDLNLKTYIAMLVGITLMEVYAANMAAHGAGFMFLVTNSLSLLFVLAMCIAITILRHKSKTN